MDSWRKMAGRVLKYFPEHADVCFFVGGKCFALHRVILCARSDYINAMLTGHFVEGKKAGESYGHEGQAPLPTITIADVSAEAFAVVVEFMYSDTLQKSLEPPLVYEVLDAGTRFLLDGLRTLCVSQIMQQTEQDAFYHFELSRIYELPRLEDHCFSVGMCVCVCV